MSTLQNSSRWLVTGCAGFIGSHITEKLLKDGQKVVGLDNFATGSKKNLEEVRTSVGDHWSNFKFLEGDIRNPRDVSQALVGGVEYVLHQAALGSVSRSLKDPQATHDNNVNGFLNVLLAAKEAGVRKIVYASSSSVYGDHPDLPKVENKVGRPLSPYALSKKINEQYADVFYRAFETPTIGLRYFNVFGPRQDFNGPYAAVIPLWVSQMLSGKQVVINGDGETSRDFCFVANSVQANIKAALSENDEALGKVLNVALGERTTLNQLFDILKALLVSRRPELKELKPLYKDFRAGDVRHSLANVDAAKKLIGYRPEVFIRQGLETSMDWYVEKLNKF